MCRKPRPLATLAAPILLACAGPSLCGTLAPQAARVSNQQGLIRPRATARDEQSGGTAAPFASRPGDGFDADDEFVISATGGAWINMEPAARTPEVGDLAQDIVDHDVNSPLRTATAMPALPSGPDFNPVGEILAGVEQAMGDASVPRIAVQIFLARTETSQAVRPSHQQR